MCDCLSYNTRHPGQKGTEEAILDPSEFFPDATKTVCVDACIADHIKALWGAGIWTLSCCCGHNQSPASVVLASVSDVSAAREILKVRSAQMMVGAWELKFV